MMKSFSIINLISGAVWTSQNERSLALVDAGFASTECGKLATKAGDKQFEQFGGTYAQHRKNSFECNAVPVLGTRPNI